MKQKIKKVMFALGLTLIGGCSAIWYLVSDPLPTTETQAEATLEVERLVDKMWSALNASAWFEAEGAAWTFRGKHRYVWDKRRGRARVKLSDELTVYFEPHTGRGRAFLKGQPAEESSQAELIAEAIKKFNNDSFWLAAPFKARDPGTQRSLVRDEEGVGILVYYASGGTTPGDRYLWRLDESGRPRLWQLWVQIIPVQGVTFSWEGWAATRSGAWIAHQHRSTLLDVPVQDVRVTRLFAELGVEDPHLNSTEWSELMYPSLVPQ